jgi:hypothetical protein
MHVHVKNNIHSLLRKGTVVLSLLLLAFLVCIFHGEKLHLGQNKISGGLCLDGDILDLIDYPQGFDFRKEVTAAVSTLEGQGEILTTAVSLRIGGTACEFSFDQMVHLD